MSTHTCSCGRPTEGAQLCPRCQRTLAIALVNVAAFYDELEVVATKRDRFGDGTASKGSIGKAQPLVVNSRFLQGDGDGARARDDVRSALGAWAARVMGDQPQLHGPACPTCLHVSCADVRRRRHPGARVGNDGTAGQTLTVRSVLAYFDRQFRWITAQTWAAGLLDDLLALERQLRRVIDRPADRWYAGKCSAQVGPTAEQTGTCQVDLYAEADSGTITCRGCGTEHDVAARRAFLLEEARHVLVTANEAAQALQAWTDYDGTEAQLRDRIQKWRDRRRLEVVSTVLVGNRERSVYRLGDVQDLLTASARHAGTRARAGAR